MTMDQGQRIVEEAQRWMGTPYHHGADVIKYTDADGKIQGGVDCAMLLVRVFCDLGLVPLLDPRPYPDDWHLHQSGQRFLGWVTEYATKVNEPQPGDVALFQFGRAMSHGGIVDQVAPEVYIIHADLDAGCVERCEVRRYGKRLAGYWRVR